MISLAKVFGHLLVILTLILSNLTPLFAANEDPINWTSAELTINSLAGTVQAVNASFFSKQLFRNVELNLSPELIDYIKVTPSNFEIIAPNGAFYSVQLAVTVPANTSLGIIEGTLYVKAADQILPQALKINLKVEEATIDTIPDNDSLPSPDRVVEDETKGTLVKDEVLVIFKPEVSLERIKQIVTEVGGVFINSMGGFDLYAVKVNAPTVEELDAIVNRLNTFSEVVAATHHYFYDSLGTKVPNDPILKLDPWNEASPSGNNWGHEFTKLPSAWDIETGKFTTKIGVIDSGFDIDHEDLKQHISKVKNNLGPTKHGTEVAGIVGAVGNNNQGTSGVMWDKSLLLYGVGGSILEKIPTLGLFKAIEHAAEDNVKVVVMSKDRRYPEGIFWDLLLALEKKFWSDFLTKIQDKNIVFVFGAGNDGKDASRNIPASLSKDFSNVITVGNIKNTGELAGDSNYGPIVDVLAPGYPLVSTQPGNQYGPVGGTSIAAPFVAGLAGLILSEAEDRSVTLSAADIKQHIRKGAETGEKWATGPDGVRIPVINAFESLKRLPINTSIDSVCINSICSGEVTVRSDENIKIVATVRNTGSLTQGWWFVGIEPWRVLDYNNPWATRREPLFIFFNGKDDAGGLGGEITGVPVVCNADNTSDMLPGEKRTVTCSMPASYWGSTLGVNERVMVWVHERDLGVDNSGSCDTNSSLDGCGSAKNCLSDTGCWGGSWWWDALVTAAPALVRIKIDPPTAAASTDNNLACPSTDQRGVSRPQGPACDIGSYELIIPLGH